MADHTTLQKNANEGQVEPLCDSSCRFGLRCVCGTSPHLLKAARQYRDHPLGQCSILAFPFEAIANKSKPAAAISTATATRIHTSSGVTTLNQKQGREGSY